MIKPEIRSPDNLQFVVKIIGKVRRGNSDQTSGLWNSRQFFSGLKALDLEPRPYTSSLSFAVSLCKLICVYSAKRLHLLINPQLSGLR